MYCFAIERICANLQFAVDTLGYWFNCFIGGVDGFITTLIILMVLDCVTGIMCAFMEKKLSLFIFLKGIFKKMLIIRRVGVAHSVDFNLFGSHEALRNTVIWFYLSYEGGSVLRNASKLGIPIPEKLKSVLSELQDKPAFSKDKSASDHGDG